MSRVIIEFIDQDEIDISSPDDTQIAEGVVILNWNKTGDAPAEKKIFPLHRISSIQVEED